MCDSNGRVRMSERWVVSQARANRAIRETLAGAIHDITDVIADLFCDAKRCRCTGGHGCSSDRGVLKYFEVLDASIKVLEVLIVRENPMKNWADLSETMAPDVAGLLVNSVSIAHVRKKVALYTCCLLSDNRSCSQWTTWKPAERPHGRDPRGRDHRSNGLVTHKNCPRDYMYYNTPCPWLLRILQQFHANGALGANSADGQFSNMLNDTLHHVLARKSGGDEESPAYKLREQTVALLARFISVTEPNISYVGLDSMYRMVRLDGDGAIVKQQETVLFSLKDADLSVRRRALDLLFVTCNPTNAQEVADELVNYLVIPERSVTTVPTTGPGLKEAILAEKYALDLRWYGNTLLQLLTIISCATMPP
ncbi:AP-2 complex subunit alpha-2 [Phytophthora pseudosyringae]|uniref:AP-2 complex subunit alpha-2 n=1 Tax=Phytophthora pseudosyringae TaxID=221518 RepID=A0A8T1VFS0_9STRA|nr:AP-2 complex subunit alpha-2 [Phytophthora pseudosyringae]